MTITYDETSGTILSGQVLDQAALYGILNKIRDLGLPLLSVLREEPGCSFMMNGIVSVWHVC